MSVRSEDVPLALLRAAPRAARPHPRLLLARVTRAVRDRIKYGLVLQSVSDILEKIGVTLAPYYVFRESISDKLHLDVRSGLSPIISSFLELHEVQRLWDNPECEDLRLEKEKLSGEGCRCFALKHLEQVVSYMVCNFRECDSRLLSFTLKDDEVYLTGAFTFPAYRGRGIAAAMESELYKQLHAMGLRTYVSINLAFNAPGLRFKQKLQSRPAALRLYIRLFGDRCQWNITLRRYGMPRAASLLLAV